VFRHIVSQVCLEEFRVICLKLTAIVVIAFTCFSHASQVSSSVDHKLYYEKNFINSKKNLMLTVTVLMRGSEIKVILINCFKDNAGNGVGCL